MISRYYITMKLLRFLVLFFTIITVATSCIEDGVSSSTADQPTFSVDTLDMGMVFTDQGSTTHRFVVYNHADKIISIGSIALRNPDQGIFRINVDGMSGREFHNVEIRPNDSIYVFVECTAPATGKLGLVNVLNHLDFTTLGVTRSVVLSADGIDVERMDGVVLDGDMHFTADRPYQIRDSLVVMPGATMTVDPGATLYFHDGAELLVYGSLQANGTAELPINMIGDRTGNVAASIPFELMSGQWGGVYFAPTSHDNLLQHTSLRNSSYGVAVDSITSTLDRPALRIINSQIRNSSGYTFQAAHSAVEIIGSEITDASQGVLYMRGGQLRINHCTLANYYLFTALGGPTLQLAHVNADDDDQSGLPYLQADITNTIIYGNGNDLSHGDLTGSSVTLRSCLLKSSGSDDDNFINCLWDTDPLYYTVREEYLFDYRVKPESPAIGAGDASLTLPAAVIDRYGRQRSNPPTIGCYEFQPE